MSRTGAGDLDVLIGIPSGVPNKEQQYEALRTRAAARDISGCTVYVADLADIIASKEAAGREKDRAALPELRALQAARSMPNSAHSGGMAEARFRRSAGGPLGSRSGAARSRRGR